MILGRKYGPVAIYIYINLCVYIYIYISYNTQLYLLYLLQTIIKYSRNNHPGISLNLLRTVLRRSPQLKTKTGQCKQDGGNAMLGSLAFLCPLSPSPSDSWPAWTKIERRSFFQRPPPGCCLSFSSSSLRAASRDALRACRSSSSSSCQMLQTMI